MDRVFKFMNGTHEILVGFKIYAIKNGTLLSIGNSKVNFKTTTNRGLI